MKQISPRSIILLVMFACMTIFSCKKDKAKTEEPKNSSCRIITVSYAGNRSVNYLYNEEGKVIKSISGDVVTTIEYSGATVVINTTQSGNFSSKYIVKLNSNGYINSLRIEGDEAGTIWNETVCEYNGGTQLIKAINTTSFNTLAEIATYTWDNGNIISSQEGNEKITYSYYSDKPQQPGDYFSLRELAGFFEVGKAFGSKNAIKSIAYDNRIENYTYETDADGKIISMKMQSGTDPVQTTNYQYQCK